MKDAIQCNNCHYMIDDNTKWHGGKYESLKDLHTARIISNASVNEDQHKACGAKGCHDSADDFTVCVQLAGHLLNAARHLPV